MDNNFWFYTLSAIPQTLGAVIALTATFVIFKLNQIESKTQIEYNEIKEWVMPLLPDIRIHDLTKLDDGEMLEKLEEGIGKLDPRQSDLGFTGYAKLCELYKDVIKSHKRHFEPTGDRIYQYLLERKRMFTHLLDIRKKALRLLKKSLLLTVVPLAGSIVFLPLYQQVIRFGFVIVILFVILAVFAVVYTARSVWWLASIKTT